MLFFELSAIDSIESYIQTSIEALPLNFVNVKKIKLLWHMMNLIFLIFFKSTITESLFSIQQKQKNLYLLYFYILKLLLKSRENFQYANFFTKLMHVLLGGNFNYWSVLDYACFNSLQSKQQTNFGFTLLSFILFLSRTKAWISKRNLQKENNHIAPFPHNNQNDRSCSLCEKYLNTHKVAVNCSSGDLLHQKCIEETQNSSKNFVALIF